MRVKILEENLKHEDEGTGVRYDLSKDDTITVPDNVGQYFCDHGWAEDVDGIYATGERKTEGVSLAPRKAVHATPTRKKGSR